jgi:hypothetical protein
MHLDQDAFSSGQVLSKLWLAETLEDVLKSQEITHPLKVLSLGGWYNILHFILRCKKKIKIEKYLSLDIDEISCDVSKKINETWVWQNNKFDSLNLDANNYSYTIEDHDCIINTSVEHFDKDIWFENIPDNAIVILQSNNMVHQDHINNHSSLDEFVKNYPLSKLFFQGQKMFQYETSSFIRFMIIGKK